MSEHREKMSYTAPELKVFGALAELTASGLGGSCEVRNNGLCANSIGGVNPASQPTRLRP